MYQQILTIRIDSILDSLLRYQREGFRIVTVSPHYLPAPSADCPAPIGYIVVVEKE